MKWCGNRRFSTKKKKLNITRNWNSNRFEDGHRITIMSINLFHCIIYFRMMNLWWIQSFMLTFLFRMECCDLVVDERHHQYTYRLLKGIYKTWGIAVTLCLLKMSTQYLHTNDYVILYQLFKWFSFEAEIYQFVFRVSPRGFRCQKSI